MIIRPILDLTRNMSIARADITLKRTTWKKPRCIVDKYRLFHYSKTMIYAWQEGFFTYNYFVQNHLHKGKSSIASNRVQRVHWDLSAVAGMNIHPAVGRFQPMGFIWDELTRVRTPVMTARVWC
ncbi:hypothetical protein OCU04_008445 [Sclerotinia nivalis]|uniref:Uncharacterized protein n=1 Tax=Sclerotinia nivalis TaxID=352851 RepID=A0A9X0ALN4_9HELO|nr:hypothetical protein OCU04_008445 [Sclerotinia nivalis]